MAGTHKKGTVDADASGKMGGSLPEKIEERVSRLEDEVGRLKALCRRNGWTLEN